MGEEAYAAINTGNYKDAQVLIFGANDRPIILNEVD